MGLYSASCPSTGRLCQLRIPTSTWMWTEKPPKVPEVILGKKAESVQIPPAGWLCWGPINNARDTYI